MYEKHFGLTSRPFRSKTVASGVFVGPAQIKLISSLKKAFAASDAIVMVTGPVGVGKSTVVNRALEGIGNQRIVAHIGRMQLAADEVLELLLTEFNVSRQPNGTIQRFAAFKRLLHDWAAAGTRVFIVVEDADRIGSDALIELEALTASDSGDGAGAGIVLMGQQTLAERLANPDLARLRQRIRLRHGAVPFSAAEALGYLKHCIRNAGGDFDSIFDPAAADMLYRCSEGIPRIINNLSESVLAAAAEANASVVMPQLVQHIAHEEFGLQPGLSTTTRALTGGVPQEEAHAVAAPKPVEQLANPVIEAASDAAIEPPLEPAVEPSIKATSTTADIPQQESAAEKVIDFDPVPVSSFSPEPEVRPVKQNVPSTRETAPIEANKPVATAEKPAAKAPEIQLAPAADAAAKIDEADAIPELIQDTQPALAALDTEDDLPDLTDLVVPGPAANPKVAAVARMSEITAKAAAKPLSADDIPTLSGALRVEKNSPAMPPPAGREPIQAASSPIVEKSADSTAEGEVKDPKVEATITEIPSWDRDPTLAQLKPDIAALEAALAVTMEPVAQEAKAAKKSAPAPAPAARSAAPAKAFDLPEITLEKELKEREIEAQELLRKTARPEAVDAEVDAPVKRKRGFDLDKITAELGKARSLEDVDDRLAETLFGEEMAAAAAEVAAMVAANEPESPLAGAALELLNDTPKAKDGSRARPTLKADTPAMAEKPPNNAANTASRKLQSSATDRKAEEPVARPSVEITLQSDSDPEPVATVTPESIEEQFGTSMTATLKALSSAQVRDMDASANDEEDEEEKPARKLFGLFRSGN
jgi:type II secretory pathway predicted ATPase ExeA